MLAVLDRTERRTFEGTVFRHSSTRHPPLSGDGVRRSGGRWNPPDSFPVVYTALDLKTVDREFTRSMRRAGLPVTGARPRRLSAIQVRLGRVLDLTGEQILIDLGISESELVADETGLTQELGSAAHHLGFEAILAPSATGIGTILAIFLDTRAADSSLTVEELDDAYVPKEEPD